MNTTSHEQKIILWVVGMALFIETLDATILNTAIPTLAKALHTTIFHTGLALTSYLLSLAIFIPISGWLAEKYGAQKIFLLGLFLFTLGSICCGLSRTLSFLVISRIIQGFGGSIMMPVARIILIKSFSKSQLIDAINAATLPAIAGPMLGPFVGGFIVSYMSWRWIFFINIPFCLAGLYLAWKYIKNHKNSHTVPLNFLNFSLFSLGLASLLIVLEMISHHAYLEYFAYASLTTFFLFVCFYIHYKLTGTTIVAFSLFKIRTFSLTAMGSFISRVAFGGIPFLLPILFQVTLGKSPLISGLLILPLALGMFVGKLVIKKLLHLLGYKYLLCCNCLIYALTVAQYIFIGSTTPALLICLMVFLNGMSQLFLFTCFNSLAYTDLDDTQINKATSIMGMIQYIGMGAGIIFTSVVISLLFPGTNINQSSTIPLKIIHQTFFIISCMFSLSLLIFSFLKKEDGSSSYQ